MNVFGQNIGIIIVNNANSEDVADFGEFAAIQKDLSTWDVGILKAYKESVTFISPALKGNVYILGGWIIANNISYTQDLLKRLSEKFNTAAAICYYPTSAFCAWLKYDNGELTRGFISDYGGDGVVLNEGLKNQTESEFEWEKIYSQNSPDGDKWIPGEREFLRMLESFGYDPEDNFLESDLEGDGYTFRFQPKES
jgi:hypothetical protein